MEQSINGWYVFFVIIVPALISTAVSWRITKTTINNDTKHKLFEKRIPVIIKLYNYYKKWYHVPVASYGGQNGADFADKMEDFKGEIFLFFPDKILTDYAELVKALGDLTERAEKYEFTIKSGKTRETDKEGNNIEDDIKSFLRMFEELLHKIKKELPY